MTPAQKNKALAGQSWPGKCCVFTTATGEYCALRPLFEYLVKDAYPDYDVKVLEMDVDPHRARCMRYLWDGGLRDYDFVLITDVDILMGVENPDPVTQHMRSITLRGTECYDNHVTGDEARMPGIHFVTRNWWDRTQLAREQESSNLEGANLNYWYDERMLYRLVANSGLPLPPADPDPEHHHGFHIGTYRANFIKGARLPERFYGLPVLRKIEEDRQAGELYDNAAKRIWWLGQLRRHWNRLYPNLRRA